MKTSANVQVINLSDGRQVCLSYGVIVAAFFPADWVADRETVGYRALAGYVRTDAKYSTTTSKHMNHFAGRETPMIPHAHLVNLCAPVASRL